jgi:hypothetical protein
LTGLRVDPTNGEYVASDARGPRKRVVGGRNRAISVRSDHGNSIIARRGVGGLRDSLIIRGHALGFDDKDLITNDFGDSNRPDNRRIVESLGRSLYTL